MACSELVGKICKKGCPIYLNRRICCQYCTEDDCSERCKQYKRENIGEAVVVAPQSQESRNSINYLRNIKDR
jgi:hypothetical protein